ncbi:MAG: hypothetical protein ACXWQ5_22255, partial [Ktedonobacterales bacterium]
MRVTLEGPKNYSDWHDAITAVAKGSKNPFLALVFKGDGAAFKEQLAVALAELAGERAAQGIKEGAALPASRGDPAQMANYAARLKIIHENVDRYCDARASALSLVCGSLSTAVSAAMFDLVPKSEHDDPVALFAHLRKKYETVSTTLQKKSENWQTEYLALVSIHKPGKHPTLSSLVAHVIERYDRMAAHAPWLQPS